MGYIRRLDTNVDIQTFPGAKFELTGDVPAPQCSEAQIESLTGIIALMGWTLTDPGKFSGYDLTDKKITILLPLADAGTWAIANNTADVLNINHQCTTDDNAVSYYIHDGGSLILTRNAKSFTEYIHAAGYAYTIKGGKLYTNMPSGLLKNACTILFDPLT